MARNSKRKDIIIKLIIVGAGFLVLLLTLLGRVGQYDIHSESTRPAPTESKEK